MISEGVSRLMDFSSTFMIDVSELIPLIRIVTIVFLVVSEFMAVTLLAIHSPTLLVVVVLNVLFSLFDSDLSLALRRANGLDSSTGNKLVCALPILLSLKSECYSSECVIGSENSHD
jgi:hypothetical protein